MFELGHKIHNLATRLFPICRSITGDGVRESLAILQQELPGLVVHQVPSGEQCFDWEVPPEWNIRDAYILDPDGNKIIDFQQSNLHVMGYSCPVNRKVALDELQAHLYSLPDQPNAIPYVTSYYQQRWGFCLSHHQRESLPAGDYEVYIDSTLAPGHLLYGELIIPGDSEQEIFLSTYLCHPSLANDNLSGVCVTTYLAKWLMQLPTRRYTYRIIFIPETIGALVYLKRHMMLMKRRMIAGFNITCVGDNRCYSYLPSRAEDTLADKVALHVLHHMAPDFIRYSYLAFGSDERQYCSPGVDLPVATITRSFYGCYPEYHTSLDDLSFISPEGLEGSYHILQKCIECLEMDEYYRLNVFGQPQLGKAGLYPTTSTKDSSNEILNLIRFIAYCDGKHSMIDIANKINVPMWTLASIAGRLKEKDLITSAIEEGAAV